MSALVDGEELTLLRAGNFRFAVPMARVHRILSAAMPMAVPSSDAQQDGLSLRLRVDSQVLSLVYAKALFGETEAVLHPEDKLVVVESASGKCILWVDSVEDMVPYVPLPKDATAPAQSEWMLTVSGGEVTVPVLDVDRVVEAARSA